MAIPQEAIDRFLDRETAYVPPFKGAKESWLLKKIEQCTGVQYEWLGMPPRPAQLEGLAMALWLRRALLFFGPRVGKTKAGLDWARTLRRAGVWRRKGLVVAHAPVGVKVWEDAALVHSDLKVRGVRTGPTAAADLEARLADDTDLVVMSWSTLQTLFSVPAGPKSRSKKALLADTEGLEELAAHFQLAIFDEIHTCQDHRSLRFKMGAAVAKHCDHRLGLTGTPIAKDPMKVWSQAFLVDEGETLGRNYHFFEAAFGKKTKVWRHRGLVDGYVFDKDKLPLLTEKLASISMSYELDELQKLVVETGEVELQMSPRQRADYASEIEAAWKVDEGDEKRKRGVFIRMRQIAAGFKPYIDEQGKKRIYYYPDGAKLVWVREFLRECGGLRFVIFYEYTPTGRQLTNLLDYAGITYSWLWGQSKDRDGAIAAFQSGEAQVMVAQNAAGSMAIDLPMADYLLFHDSPASARTRKQAESRPLNRGTRPLYIDDLVAAPVDRRVLGFVRQGKNAHSALMGKGSWRKLLKGT